MADFVVQITQQESPEVIVTPASTAPAASSVPFTPAGTVSATNVQAAIVEVASEAGGGGAPAVHAPTHTNGTDDIASATASQKGLATPAQITKLDGIETGATADQTRPEIVGLWTGTPDGTKFLRDDGALVTPAGGGSGYRTLVTLGSDVANSTTSYADVTGLSFSVTSGTMYRFYILLLFDASSATIGSMWSMNGPASPTTFGYTLLVPRTGSIAEDYHSSSYDSGSGALVSSPVVASNVAVMQGFIKPSTSGIAIVRFKAETGGTITAKAGSTLEYW